MGRIQDKKKGEKWLYVLVLICGFSPVRTQGQNFREWWRQKQTKVEYMLRQVALIQTYLGYVKEGYRIADQGLKTIGHIADGEFNLHRDFFGSLKGINPKIGRYAKVADIVAMQLRLIDTQQRRLGRLRESGQFTEKELGYFLRVYTRLLDQSAGNISELVQLLTADELELSDKARLDRIDALHADMGEKCAFADWFGSETDLLALQRRREGQETRVVSGLEGIKQ